MRKFVSIPVGLTLAGLILLPTRLFAYTGEQLAKGAKVSIEQARAVALQTWAGTIIDEELEREKGGSGLRYSFDIKSDSAAYEVGVDAQSGKVLENKKEGPHPVALERVLGIELLIILTDEGERVPRIAERVANQRSDAINARLEEITKLCTCAAVGRGLYHRVAGHTEGPPAKILGDVAFEVEDVTGVVIGCLVLEVHTVNCRTVELPSGLRMEIGGGNARQDQRPMVEACVGKLFGAVVAGGGEGEHREVPMEIAFIPTEDHWNDAGVAGCEVGVASFKVEGAERPTKRARKRGKPDADVYISRYHGRRHAEGVGPTQNFPRLGGGAEAKLWRAVELKIINTGGRTSKVALNVQAPTRRSAALREGIQAEISCSERINSNAS